LHPEGKTVYMPHAVIPTTYLFSSFDYDQYFVFGESSVRNLANQDLRFGETRIVKVGSPRILPGYVLPEAEPSHHFLYFSNWMIGEDERYTRDFEILRAWALDHPEYQLTVKLHPLEKNGYVPRRCKGIPNMRVLPSGTGMKEALESVCLVISSFSSAMVEAALMKRPSVIVNTRKYDPESKDVRESDKLLYLEQFFTARAQTPEQLQQRIEQTLQNYSHYISRGGEFVKFHYEYTLDAPERIAEEIINIIQSKNQ
jgi:CDP-glycerol glycerophosphotransferase (TagB/SpsB family)